MSKYVKRCPECRRVRGMTAFVVVKAGERADVCRFCVSLRASERTSERITTRMKLRDLRHRESRLRCELARVEREKLALSLQLQRAG